ncbi:heat shock 70 kDa protein homolog [Folsomia candida]|uniref:heat shock 70 kDa protein homolog n=1 Tax=Folsomia candida TaxID=158441 RepID=UPI0016050AD1|nr:heat shock 70 kDa protein homolog [Folsomia candida]
MLPVSKSVPPTEKFLLRQIFGFSFFLQSNIFSDSQKQATKDAGEVAGLNVLGILNEPTAAAIAYSLSYTDELKRNVVIYDLGGGTFDVSILAIQKGEIEVKAVGGNNHLGGQDFDNAMLDHCLKEFQLKHGIDLRTGDRDTIIQGRLRRIRHICEKEKIGLSETSSVTVIAEAVTPDKNLSVAITQDQFNEMNNASFLVTIDVVKKALAEAHLTPDDIDDVVLVGGSIRIPKVQQMLQDCFPGKTLNMKLNPDEVVARGQQFMPRCKAAHKPGSWDIFHFLMLPHFHLELKLPATKTKQYTTSTNNQTEVTIKVFEGEDKVATENNLLGTFSLTGIPPGPVGREKIDVTIDVNKEGILNVTAKIISTGGNKEVRIDSQRTNLTREEIARLA